MSSLDRHDGVHGRQVAAGIDGCFNTQIRRHYHAFELVREVDKGLDVSHAEVVGAVRYGSLVDLCS